MDEQLGIAGSGTIACGLAAAAAQLGEVVLWARSDASAARARGGIDKLCGRMEIDGTRVTIVSELDGLGDCTFVAEAIVEETGDKSVLLAKLNEIMPEDSVLATTTSSLSVEELATASGRPERFVGLHVFNPVTRMKLIELVFPAAASADTRERAAALCVALGKEAVEIPDVPGFVVNRLLFPYLFDAVRLMLETGMAPEAIDTCMKLGAGHPMGPLALLDLVGLDVSVAIGEAIGADVPDHLRELIQAGRLGRKTGGGVYPPQDA